MAPVYVPVPSPAQPRSRDIEFFMIFPESRSADIAAGLLVDRGYAVSNQRLDVAQWGLSIRGAPAASDPIDLGDREMERMAEALGGSFDGHGQSVPD